MYAPLLCTLQPVAYGYPPVTTCIVTPVHQYMQHPITSPANFPMSPAQIAMPTPATPTLSERILDESPVRPRKDGRRSISLSEAPNLSKGTPLYGNPAWWGEEDPTSDTELPSSSPGGRILRDLEPDRPRTAELDRTWRGSTGHELRKKAISNRALERGSDSPTSWVIELDSAPNQRPSRRLDKEQRPRSADPSPIRRRNGVSPVRRSVSPCPSPRHSPVPQRKSTTVSKKTKVLTSTQSRKPPAKKPPSGATPTSKPRPEPKQSQTELISHSESPVSARVEPFSWNESHSGSSQGSPSSHRPRKCPSDTHVGFKTDTTYIISEMERPGSARKQWTNVQPLVRGDYCN